MASEFFNIAADGRVDRIYTSVGTFAAHARSVEDAIEAGHVLKGLVNDRRKMATVYYSDDEGRVTHNAQESFRSTGVAFHKLPQDVEDADQWIQARMQEIDATAERGNQNLIAFSARMAKLQK